MKKLGSFGKYSISSVVCFLLDYGLFTLLNAVILRGMADGARELVATYGARIVSAVVNFLLNRNVVFGDTSDPRGAAVRYTVLAVVQAAVSAALVYLIRDLSGGFAAYKKDACVLLASCVGWCSVILLEFP